MEEDIILGNTDIGAASYYGHLDKVKILLANPQVDPSTNNNYAIRWASYKGYIEIVKLLAADRRVDPSSLNNWGIWWAFLNNHFKVVEFLFELININPINFTNGQIIKIDDIYVLIDHGEIINWLSNGDCASADYAKEVYLKWLYRIGGEKWAYARNLLSD